MQASAGNQLSRIAMLVFAAAVAVCLVVVSRGGTTSPTMVSIAGGSFSMGDQFEEGSENEKPVHDVRVSDFHLAVQEVTVGALKDFVQATRHTTSAESFDSREAQEARLTQLMTMDMGDAEQRQAAQQLLAQLIESGGCFDWQPDAGRFGFSVDCNWRRPLFAQTDDHPVICLSWNDAAAYCNWLSDRDDLAAAYDLESGELLDGHGKPTTDITAVDGYRLPTESEWEYAARDGGKQVRFGNGQDVARVAEIGFDASRGEYPYLEPGDRSRGTVPVRSFQPNALGLFDMSGNAWEWCSDHFAAYRDDGEEIIGDPYVSSGRGRVIRGGRWGGDAREARAAARVSYERSNRCNNSGFRVARSR